MLNEKLKKVMAGKKSMPDHEKDAKISVVKHLRDMAMGAMKDKMSAKHQVSVASDSAGGLQRGLQKAQQFVGADPDNDAAQDAQQQPPGMYEGGKAKEVDGDEPEHDTDETEEAQMLHDAENPEHDALSAHEEHDPEPGMAHGGTVDPDESMDEDQLNAKLEKLMKMRDGKKAKKSNQPY